MVTDHSGANLIPVGADRAHGVRSLRCPAL